MFRNLRSAILAEEMTVEGLADILKIHKNSLHNKLQSRTEFTLTEVKAIRGLFGKYTFEYLFKQEEK